MDNERIEGRAAAEARPERIGLGRYLMSGMTQEEREGLALPLLRAISRTAGGRNASRRPRRSPPRSPAARSRAPTSCAPATQDHARLGTGFIRHVGRNEEYDDRKVHGMREGIRTRGPP